MHSPDVHIKFSPELLAKIDKAAAAMHQSRSQFIRESIVLRLNDQRVVNNQDEESKWQDIINQSIGLVPPEV